MAAPKFSARYARWALGRAATRLVPALKARMPFYDKVVSFTDAGESETINEAHTLSLSAAEKEFAARLRPIDALPARVERSIALVRLSDVSVFGNTGAIVDERRELLLQPRDGPGFAGYHDFRAEATVPLAKAAARYFHMLGPHRGHRHFFHFLLERLPRLYYLLGRFALGREAIVVLVNDDLPEFQRDIYRFLAKRYPNLRFEVVPRRERWRLPNLFVVDDFQPVKRTLANAAVLDFVRKLVFEGYGIAPSEQERRLYLTRSDTKKRRIANERELRPLLGEHGFDIVAPGTLPFRDQVALFRSATAVAGPHGAGFTNNLFAPKSARVLEIFPADKVKNTYFLLAHSLGQSYRGLVAGQGGRKEWFRVDVVELERALDEMDNKD